jgi:3-hydroxybutyryl-CoA dehydratase
MTAPENTMSKGMYEPRGRYFEEFEIGQTIATTGRTITESDIVSFAGLTGDYNQIHIDAEYAAGEMFGQRVAHGLLILSIAMGLAVQTSFMERTVLAFRELEWKFSLPTMIGDTIHVVMEIIELKPMPRLDGGNVSLKVSVLNQNDKVVNRGNWVALVKSRPG